MVSQMVAETVVSSVIRSASGWVSDLVAGTDLKLANGLVEMKDQVKEEDSDKQMASKLDLK